MGHYNSKQEISKNEKIATTRSKLQESLREQYDEWSKATRAENSKELHPFLRIFRQVFMNLGVYRSEE